MRLGSIFTFAALAVCFLASAALGAPEGWHTSIKDGLEASEKSGKPLLLVTGWAEKI